MANVITDGLQVYYNMNSGAGASSWEDLSGNGKNGAVTGVTVDADGYNFPGSSADYIQIPSPLSDITSYTIDMWIKAPAQTIQSTLFGWMWNTSANYDNYLGLETSGLIRSFVGSDTSNTTSDSTTAITYNTPQHVAMSATGTTVKLYLNGSPVGTFTVSALEPVSSLPSTFVDLGRRPGANDRPFTGHIQVVRLYNRVLSDTEVTQNYNIGTAVGLTNTTVFFDNLTASTNWVTDTGTPTYGASGVSLSGGSGSYTEISNSKNWSVSAATGPLQFKAQFTTGTTVDDTDEFGVRFIQNSDANWNLSRYTCYVTNQGVAVWKKINGGSTSLQLGYTSYAVQPSTTYIIAGIIDITGKITATLYDSTGTNKLAEYSTTDTDLATLATNSAWLFGIEGSQNAVGTNAGVAYVTQANTASFTGQGTLNVTAVIVAIATAPIVGQGSLTVTGVVEVIASTSMTGQGSLTGNAIIGLSALANIQGQGTLSVTGLIANVMSAVIQGQGTLSANGTVNGVAAVIVLANIAGQGSVSASPVLIWLAKTTVTGQGTLTPTAVIIQLAVLEHHLTWVSTFDKAKNWNSVFDKAKTWVGGV